MSYKNRFFYLKVRRAIMFLWVADEEHHKNGIISLWENCQLTFILTGNIFEIYLGGGV